MRLIDADALKKYIKQEEDYDTSCTFCSYIDNAPTVENVTIFRGCDNCELERPQGEWEENVETSCGKILRWRANVVEQKCNKCKRYTLRWSDTMVSEFCSNCGADMKGGKEE